MHFAIMFFGVNYIQQHKLDFYRVLMIKFLPVNFIHIPKMFLCHMVKVIAMFGPSMERHLSKSLLHLRYYHLNRNVDSKRV